MTPSRRISNPEPIPIPRSAAARSARPRPSSDPTPDAQLARADRAARAALERKAHKLVAFDVRELTSYADTFVLATGGSDRQVRAIADAVKHALAESGEQPLGHEGYEEGRWVLLDFVEVVVHVFHEKTREYYMLDRLWGDAHREPSWIRLADQSATDSLGRGVSRAPHRLW